MRDRTGTFLRFLFRRFLDDRLFQAAAALSYTTVFAIAPFTVVVFGVLSAFPVFDQWRSALTGYVFSHFLPGSASAVQGMIDHFLRNASKLSLVGAVCLIVSLLITLNSIEGTFNRIWRVPSARPKLSRFLVYWTVLTLGAIFAAAALAMSAWVLTLPLFNTEGGKWIVEAGFRATPILIEFGLIAVIFRVVPHREVQRKHALIGALLATVILEAIKGVLGLYVGAFSTYQTLYGALSALPVLMLWIYLGWVSILLGASFASAIASFRYQPAWMRLPAGFELYGLLRLLGRFEEVREEGRGLKDDEILKLEPSLTDALVQQFIADLSEHKVLALAESGEWLLARDLESIDLSELYEACQLRIPIIDAQLPRLDDALGRAALHTLDRLRVPLRDLLKLKVSDAIHLARVPETEP